MNVLVACEFSGAVRDAFIRRGHNAVSCDLLETESPGPHIAGDVLNIVGGGAMGLVDRSPSLHAPCS